MPTAREMALRAAGLDRLEVFAEPTDHPEGIAISPEGTIYAGGEAGQLYVVEDDVSRELANTGGFVLGLALDGENRLYACDAERKCVFRLDPASGDLAVFASGLEGRPMNLPNYPAFDARGNLYVTDSGGWKTRDGLVWVVRPGGRLEVFSEQSCDFPNGAAVAADGSRLYVLESTPGRIVEIPIDDDGSAGAMRVLCELDVVPDGVAVADDGSLVVSCYRPDAIYRWSETEGLELLASDPEGQVLVSPTNVAFTGPDLEVAVLANVAGWYLTRGSLGVRGTSLARPGADLLGD